MTVDAGRAVAIDKKFAQFLTLQLARTLQPLKLEHFRQDLQEAAEHMIRRSYNRPIYGFR